MKSYIVPFTSIVPQLDQGDISLSFINSVNEATSYVSGFTFLDSNCVDFNYMSKFYRVPPAVLSAKRRPSVLVCANSPIGLLPVAPLLEKGYDVTVSVSQGAAFNGSSILVPSTVALLSKFGVALTTSSASRLSEWVWTDHSHKNEGAIRIARHSWRSTNRTNLSELSDSDLFPHTISYPGSGTPPADLISSVSPPVTTRASSIMHIVGNLLRATSDMIVRPVKGMLSAMPLPPEIRPINTAFNSHVGALSVSSGRLAAAVYQAATNAAAVAKNDPKYKNDGFFAPPVLTWLATPVNSVAHDAGADVFVRAKDGDVNEVSGTGEAALAAASAAARSWVFDAVVSTDPSFGGRATMLRDVFASSGSARVLNEASCYIVNNFMVDTSGTHGLSPALEKMPEGVLLQVPNPMGANFLLSRNGPKSFYVTSRPVMGLPMLAKRMGEAYPTLSPPTRALESTMLEPRNVMGVNEPPFAVTEPTLFELGSIKMQSRGRGWDLVTEVGKALERALQGKAFAAMAAARNMRGGTSSVSEGPLAVIREEVDGGVRMDATVVLGDALATGPEGRVLQVGSASFVLPWGAYDIATAATAADVDQLIQAAPTAAQLAGLEPLSIAAANTIASRSSRGAKPRTDDAVASDAKAAESDNPEAVTAATVASDVCSARAARWEATVGAAFSAQYCRSRARTLKKLGRSLRLLARSTNPQKVPLMGPAVSLSNALRQWHPLWSLRHNRVHRLLSKL